MHPLEEQLTFMDWVYRICFFLGIVGGGALLVLVLVLAIT